jgi:import inner membrane translocase subunit TIM44
LNETIFKDCEKDIIPNILEAMTRGDLEILQDWCYEGTYNILADPIRKARQMGYYFDSQILDIENIDLAMGKMMEHGPVLIITFHSQQVLCVRNSKHEVIEGDPDKVVRIAYVWVLCRDQTELDPSAAWRLLELSAQSTDQFL